MLAIKKYALAAACASLSTLAAQSASAATYDFLSAANAGGGVGESIFSTFSTSSAFSGPNLDITATAVDDDPFQFVYFDNGNAGIGVCKDPTPGASINTATNGGSNACDPGSDDGITSLLETLTFKATQGPVRIDAIWMNANHDSPSVFDASYTINGVVYTAADMTPHNVSGSGNVRIDLGFTLGLNESFSLTALRGSPDSYISAISLAAVPIPASLLLLGSGLAGLGLMRRRRKAA